MVGIRKEKESREGGRVWNWEKEWQGSEKKREVGKEVEYRT